FDLERGPLFRAALHTGEPALLLTAHHVVCDGWSAGVVLDEVVAAYGAYATGGEPDLPEPEFQYADYADWQERWLAGPAAARQAEHWREALAAPLPVLPVGSTGAPARSGANHPVERPADPVPRRRALAAESGASFFVVLLTAFTAVLREVTGSDDVVVGTVSAGRARDEFDGTVGYLVNTLAVRTRLPGPATFRELLRRVRESALDAQANQDLPFDLVVEHVKPPRAPDRHPVFQALLTYNELRGDARQAAGLRFTPVLLDGGTAKFPLSLEFNETDGGLEANVEYRADLFDAAHVADLAERLRAVLRAAADDPDHPLAAAAAPDGAAEPDGETPYAPPTTDVERVLAEVWARALGLARVGIDDNYFELGGDSIRSVQLLGLARERGLAVRITDLVLLQTIRELAPLVTAAAPVRESARLDLLAEADRGLVGADLVDAYPLSALQAGMLYHSQAADSEQIYHDVATYHLRAEHSEDAWRRAVATVLERHEVLRTSFEVTGFTEPVQLVHAAVPAPLTFEDLRGLDAGAVEAAVAARFALERARPFDWSAPPLIRFHVQRRADDEAQLWIVEHHAILDGWSGRSLFAELLNADAAHLGHPAPLPPPPRARFRSLIALERAALADPAQRAFWT
ncbi:condensation domain-containing protein, partial [Actinosynnema sp.]|uniref:condensation domain-containing protein n=1 Tax=Actinosynnema sp. TaxID=1872144 RepID=UPI003F84EBCF